MKILYAIQGTGNGHLSRARDIIPILKNHGEVDVLISGIECDLSLPHPVKFVFKGLSFVFGKKGGIDLLATYRKSNLKRLYNEIKSLPVEEYDLVISDFEPVSAWACRLKKKDCIGLSHQAAVMNAKSPKPKKKDLAGQLIMKNYAPVTYAYGFHFGAYDKNIFTPVIRSQIRDSKATSSTHYTVYLPAYSDKKIIKVLGQIPNIQWQVFSKRSRKPSRTDNISIQPIQNEAFIKSLVTCTGVLCGAGFETPAEALYLKKKLMVIPMKGQYEQQCNAATLKSMGVPVLKSLKAKHLEKIVTWTSSQKIVSVNYPNITSNIIKRIIRDHSLAESESQAPKSVSFNFKKLKKESFLQTLHRNGI